jgi:hypothetical protein
MNIQQIANRIQKLSPDEQHLVEQFLDRLERNHQHNVAPSFEEAMREFMQEHPTIMRLLAK